MMAKNIASYNNLALFQKRRLVENEDIHWFRLKKWWEIYNKNNQSYFRKAGGTGMRGGGAGGGVTALVELAPLPPIFAHTERDQK